MDNYSDSLQLKSILWSGPQYLELRQQMYYYLKQKYKTDDIGEMVETLQTIPVLTIFEFFQTEVFADPNHIFFYSLPEEQKTFISMMHTSYDFVHSLVVSFAEIYSINEKEIRLKLQKQPHEEADDSLLALLNQSIDLDNKRLRLKILQGELADLPKYLKYRELFDGDTSLKHINEIIAPIQYTPSLRKVFDCLVRIKRCFIFLLDLFCRILEPINHFHIDFKTYNTLYESVTGDNYEQFTNLIDNWDIEVTKELSLLVDKVFPLALYIESQATDSMLNSIRDDLTTVLLEQKFESSLIRTLLIFLTDFIFINIMKNHVNDIAKETLCSLFSIEFQAQHYEWINSEVEEVIDYFKKNLHEIEFNDTVNNGEKSDVSETCSNETKLNQEGTNLETPQDSKQEHLSVPYSQGVIRKLAEGLVKGHDALDFPNLVSSEIGDDDAINKLVFLFKGKADIMVKEPYNLQWNKNYNLNGLKLLIYLLHFTGEFENNDPLNALDDNVKSKDGISELVKFKNTGRKRIFPIVEEAFNKGKKSIQNAPRPKRGNRFFLEQIVQFWFYCKNSDKATT